MLAFEYCIYFQDLIVLMFWREYGSSFVVKKSLIEVPGKLFKLFQRVWMFVLIIIYFLLLVPQKMMCNHH